LVFTSSIQIRRISLSNSAVFESYRCTG